MITLSDAPPASRCPALTFTEVLRDGTPVLIRPVVPEDKPLLREGFERLSDVSRHRRCMRGMRELSAEQLAYFTEIDYRDHMAWVALDASRPTELGLGVAQYVRLPEQPACAEVAVTVADSHQGKGLGTLLLGVLAQSAVDGGIDTWVAYVLSDNTPMLKLFRDLGAHAARVEEPGLMRVEIPVPRDPSLVPDTAAGRVFKAVTREVGALRRAP